MGIEVVELIRTASSFSAMIPIVFYLISFQRSPVQHHIIGALVLLSCLADLMTFHPSPAVPMINNAYSFLQFLLITWFYYELLYKKKFEPMFLICIGVYIATLILSLLKYKVFEMYFDMYSVEALIIVLHTAVYVFTVQHMTAERYFDNNLLSNMIFTVSMFGYFTLSSILPSAVTSLKDMSSIRIFWTVHNIFNILKHLGFAIGFYYTGKRKIYMTMEQLERIARKMEEENP